VDFAQSMEPHRQKILAIADDLTGAAEIAGVGWRYGLQVHLGTLPEGGVEADLTVIDSKSRSLPEAGATQAMHRLVQQIRLGPLPFLYKKTDSVLRGHVRVEIEALRNGLGIPRALLIPANPSLGRTIENGHYFICGKPLSQTDFFYDPEYPRTTDEVLLLLGSGQPMDFFLPAGRALPSSGIAIAEARTHADLLQWAGMMDNATLAAGGAEFFEALLEKQGRQKRPPTEENLLLTSKKVLAICGSTSAYSHAWRRQGRVCGIPCFEMEVPGDYSSGAWNEKQSVWQPQIQQALATQGKVIVGIALPVFPGIEAARQTAAHLALLIGEVLAQDLPDELLIEGGATATALLEHMNWQAFASIQELAMGVVRMRPVGCGQPAITLKPGSYSWPHPVQALFGSDTGVMQGGHTFPARAPVAPGF